MNIGFDCIGHLVVDNQCNVGYVDTTTGEIGGNEDVGFPRAEGLQSRFSLLLILARMKRCGAPLFRP